jgi:hypothetical protein
MRACLLLVLVLCGCAPSVKETSINPGLPSEAQVLLERRDQEGKPVWADGNALTFVYEGEAESVEICCGLQEPLTRLPDSNV